MSDLVEKLMAAGRAVALYNEIQGDIKGGNNASCTPFDIGYINMWEPTWEEKRELEPYLGWPITQWGGSYAYYMIEGVKFLFSRGDAKC